MSPFEALYGYKPSQLGLGPMEKVHSTEAGEIILERKKMIQVLKENLQSAVERMKKCADIYRSEREFVEGD